MRIGGISKIGKNHKKNQDSYLFYQNEDKRLIVLSDGLGSRKYSEVGSKKICESVKEVTKKTDFENNFYIEIFLDDIHKTWIKKLLNENKKIEDCYATVLFVIYCKNKIISARLGDGFIAFYDKNKQYILYDKKEERFFNETNCLNENFLFNDWETKIVESLEFKGAMICTDGVEIMNDNYADFSRDFFNVYNDKKIEYIEKDIKKWFSEWTENDDKTLVYMLGEINGRKDSL